MDLESLIARSDGASPAYIKELLRKAAVLAASQGTGSRVSGDHLDVAMAELSAGGQLAQRILGFRPADQPSPPPAEASAASAPQPAGFPPVAWTMRVDNPR